MSTFQLTWWFSALIAALTCLKLLTLRDFYDYASAACLCILPGLNTIVAGLGTFIFLCKCVERMLNMLPDPPEDPPNTSQ